MAEQTDRERLAAILDHYPADPGATTLEGRAARMLEALKLKLSDFDENQIRRNECSRCVIVVCQMVETGDYPADSKAALLAAAEKMQPR